MDDYEPNAGDCFVVSEPAPVARDVLVYVAAPLGASERWSSTVPTAILAGDRLAAAHPRLLVYVPHALGPAWDAYVAHDYEWWMSHCLGMVARCDAVLRVPGDSPGADRETALAHSLKIPVFHTQGDLLQWLEAREGDR